jgi:hypothetical protein
MPEARPAPAPQIGLIHAFGSDVEYICNLWTKGESEDGVGMVLKLVEMDGSSRRSVAY